MIHENNIQKYFGCSANSPYNQLIPLIKKLALSDSPILIKGETGSGKERMARFLHEFSNHNTKPWSALNCAALNDHLLESELFGHTKGSFSGASHDYIGRLRSVNGGTLFLDEIAELSLSAQAKLLRVLQEKMVCPVGSFNEYPVQFRLICATHKNLQTLVKSGMFREDLYYRIHIIPVSLPSLRERKMDLEILANNIWRQLSDNQESKLNQAEIKQLAQYNWPGNIRELANILEQYFMFRELGVSLNEILPISINKFHQKNPEKLHYLLQDCGNNRSLLARKLGISRGSINYQLKKISK
jgi:transcriptional regulator with PAS, ATPase and Fis domain